MKYDFSKLTENQKWLLTMGGWWPGRTHIKQPGKSTVKKLIDRGLIKEVPMYSAGMRVIAYEVPADVHFAWCQHCAETYKDEE